MSEESGVAAVFHTRIEAEIARARLEALGIAAWIDADDAGGLYPQFQIRGVRLRVAAADKLAAERILALPEAENDETRGDLEEAERTLRDESRLEASRPRFSAATVLIALLALAALGVALWTGAQ
jgi:hypothetical protein